MKKKTGLLMLGLVIMTAGIAWAQAQEPGLINSNKGGMSLLEILKTGGFIMILQGFVSIFMFSLVMYLFVRLNPEKLLPREHTDRVIALIRQKNYAGARAQCLANENLISSIALVGLGRIEDASIPPAEAAELAARKEIANFWNSLSYLSDVSQVAPMLGLLGTVIGMIQAFNTIAFDAGVVKPLMLAGGVAKAMITTAAGLCIAITAMIFYSILRVRVLNLSNYIEAETSQLMEAFSQ